ncbi:MAG: argininosuccinate lyase [Anaerolineae bacterium]|nr:argininosuccinate lyase [Anaerolineae bacterium]
MARLWGGRFSGPTDELMWQFNSSLHVDRRLAREDVRGSIAYARALGRAGVLADDEVTSIVQGLDRITAELQDGSFPYAATDEDIHTAVERRLGELIGDLAGKLHTGRSRNDQVATDVRLYLLAALDNLRAQIIQLQSAIVDQAERHLDVLMPGYTHLQPAQPVRFSHWLMSFFWMMQRDRDRLDETRARASRCPLGAGALAGNAYSIDRETLAKELGFAGITENSMDAVADRDMILDTLYFGATLGVHLSRLAEDLIIYTSVAYGFVRLDERYTTGSSIMPQKRNPDSLELVRGKAGRLTGNLVRLLTVIKATPSTYDKDLQEDKEPLFDTVDTLSLLLPIVAGVVRTLRPCPEAMRAALEDGLLATDLADYLVKRGIPFRQAHELVGKAVLAAENAGVGLSDLSLMAYQAISPAFADDLYQALDIEASVEARSVTGGTSRKAVTAQIARARKFL